MRSAPPPVADIIAPARCAPSQPSCSGPTGRQSRATYFVSSGDSITVPVYGSTYTR